MQIFYGAFSRVNTLFGFKQNYLKSSAFTGVKPLSFMQLESGASSNNLVSAISGRGEYEYRQSMQKHRSCMKNEKHFFFYK